MRKNNEILKKNIDFLLEFKKHNRLSLSDGSGVNRTTIYNILEGKVDRVQENTIRKFANFFGVSFLEIQETDLREKSVLNSKISLNGNKNPIAIPIVKESKILSSLDAKIGNMIVTLPLTYYFGEGDNIIGLILDKSIPGYYEKDDIIVLKRKELLESSNVLVYTPEQKLSVISFNEKIPENVNVIGSILEERYGGK